MQSVCQSTREITADRQLAIHPAVETVLSRDTQTALQQQFFSDPQSSAVPPWTVFSARRYGASMCGMTRKWGLQPVAGGTPDYLDK